MENRIKRANKVICKVCNKIKTKEHTGWYNSKDKIFTDETGSAWNGRTCPTCHQEKIKVGMQKLREKANG